MEKIFAVERKQRRVHDFEDAGEEGRGFERAYALLLQQVGEGIDFTGELAEGIARGSSAGAKRVIALAQRRNDVGEGLERAHQAFN